MKPENCGPLSGSIAVNDPTSAKLSAVNTEKPLRGFAGLLSASLGLGVGELLAGIFSGVRSPVISVGDRVVDGVPSGIKATAIGLFGTNDKTALLVGILVIVGIGAVLVGIGSARSMRTAVIGVGAFVVIGSLFAVTGRLGSGRDVVPIIGAGLVALAGVYALVRRPAAAHERATAATPTGRVIDEVIGGSGDSEPRRGMRVDRRQFVVLGSGTALASIATAALGRRLQGNEEASALRNEVQLPSPSAGTSGATSATTTTVGSPGAASAPSTAVPSTTAVAANRFPVAGAAQVDVAGVTPFFVPNKDFYRIDTALVVPRVDVRTWSLSIDGMVERPLKFTLDDLLKREVIEHDCTLMCVSNEIGGDLVGNARWLGVRLADILEEAGVKSGANQVFARSVDDFTAGFPTELALDGREAMLAFGMNGEPLPFAHGFPVRLVVPGIYGYVSAVKWLKQITLTTFEADQGYWIPRGWSALGPIKTCSRIDVPGRSTGQIKAGKQAIAGIAWAQHVGIAKVEVQVDDEPWREAELAADGGIDTWRQWKLAWEATAGTHSISVRATDKAGKLQTEERADVAPDGATGWHTIQVNVLSA